jgi:hypothetical protein
MTTAPENRHDTEKLRELLKELQAKYDQQSAEVADLKSKVSAWKKLVAECENLQEKQIAKINVSFRREESYARMLMFQKARNYRFTQPTGTEDHAKDAHEMAKVLTKDGYRDVIKWINNAISPESIITRIR